MGDEQTRVRVSDKHEDPAHDALPDDSAPVESPPAEAKSAEVPPLPLPVEGEGEDSIVGEFLLFLKEEKKWWLAPLVAVLLALSAIIMFAEGSAIAPFIYTIF